MRKTWALLAALCVLPPAMAARFDQGPSDDWLKERQREFALFQKTNPKPQLRIERLKQRTQGQMRGHPLGGVGDPPVSFRVIGGISHIWDVAVAPRLTVIPAGEFTMGSPESEGDRLPVEGPQHRVRIAYPLAVGTYPVTRDEYAVFVAETRRPDPEGCWLTQLGDQKSESKGFNWHNPGFDQSGGDPVVCVSWEDARDYTAWLTTRTGERYRLLSEAEGEFASRGGSSTVRPWGDAITPDDANYRAEPDARNVTDRWTYTSPVGSFAPNAFGLYDVLGNVWQRLDDCWTANYVGAPADGSVWRSGDCHKRTGHAGAFDSPPIYLRSAFRGSVPDNLHFADGGFRIAREL